MRVHYGKLGNRKRRSSFVRSNKKSEDRNYKRVRMSDGSTRFIAKTLHRQARIKGYVK